jgi:DNA-directed RNA polymerase-3 subunit RPC5
MDDPVVASLPIYLSTGLAPNLQLYQYPLLQRPLQVPPSAKVAGKRINARFKPETDIIEIHVPFDTREEVWNKEKSREYGQSSREEDGQKVTSKEEKHLDDLRLRSERIQERAVYMVGVIRESELACLSHFRSSHNIILSQINCTSTVFRRPTNSVQT